MSGNKMNPQKPLKGETIVSNFGSFDTISANSIVLQSVSIVGLFQDGVFQNVNIIDSNIDNTIIGLNVRNAGYFTSLSTNSDVTFLSLVPGGPTVTWNAETGVFNVSSDLVVGGCSLLGNIEICGNDIKADNVNGDIHLIPNGLGTLYLDGPVTLRTTNGNFLTELPNGKASFALSGNFDVYSSAGNVNVTSFNDQLYKTINGDITLSTETQPTLGNITSILNTGGNTRVTTQVAHNLQMGDVVTISNTNGIDNVYTVGNVLSSNSFLLSQFVSTGLITRGNYLKTLSNNIAINTRISDPIVTVGDYTLQSTDNKDRGIEYRYYDQTTGQMRLGWFGWKASTNQFTYIPNATNNGEVISGDPGEFNIGDVTAKNLSIASGGNLNLNCGSLLNVKSITACNGTISVVASNRIGLSAGTDILFDPGVPIRFGTNASLLVTSSGSTTLSSRNDINFSSGIISVPQGAVLSFDGTTNGTQRITSNSSGDLTLTTSRNINLMTTSGNVIVPYNTAFQLGTSNTLVSNSGGLAMNAMDSMSLRVTSGNISLQAQSGDIQLYSSGLVRTNTTLVFGTTGTVNNIKTSQNNLVISGNTSNGNITLNQINTINLDAASNVNVPSTLVLSSTGRLFVNSGDTFIVNTSGNTNVISTNVNFTSANMGIVNTTTNVVSSVVNMSSGTLTVRGATTQLYSDNVVIRDPIVTLGDTSSVGDIRDRGVEYRYFNNTTASLGWFGYKSTTGNFTFYETAVNNNEIMTGTLGSIEAAGLTLTNNLQFQTRGIINVNCGTLANVNTITSCNGVLNVLAPTSTNVSSGAINLAATSSVNVPYNVPLQFGTGGNLIKTSTNGALSVVSGLLQIESTGLNIYSTTVNVQDPIVSIGGVTASLADDLKDRGVEFKWGTQLTGFFGYKNNLGRFVFIQNGTNANEVFTGPFGDVQFGNGYFSNLDVSNGNINNVSAVVGGNVRLVSTSGNLQISAGNIGFPTNTILYFGNTYSSVSSSTAGITITNTSGVNVLTNGQINLSPSVNISTANLLATGGQLVITNTSGNILLDPASGGSVQIPINNYLSFGSTQNSLLSDGQQLFINGYTGVGIQSSTFTISGNVNIIGSLTTLNTSFDLDNYILPLGKDYKTSIVSITNTSGNQIRVETSAPHYLKTGDTVTLLNTDTVPKVDNVYTVQNVLGNTVFYVAFPSGPLTTNGTKGTIKTTLMFDPEKDVGIQVNYWRNTTGNGITTGSAYYKNAFFGWKNTLNRWLFYESAIIVNDVVTGGTLGNVQINELFPNRINAFTLTGAMSAGSNAVIGSNFQIQGGAIDATPIGVNSAQSGRFSVLSNTVSASFSNATFTSSVAYTFERYTLNSSTLQTRNPSINQAVSLFSVSGVSYTTSSGTMPTLVTSVPDGTYKMLVCSSMGAGCEHSIYFGAGKLITPNPLSGTPPVKLVFKRAGQSCQLIFDGVQGAWIILNSGVYVA
ncbi:hypothetical protein EB118_13915 [bacterium]|nr:hypothetical protein [bacterium]